MSELFIIAGPQAAGKSTTISSLVTSYRSIAALFPCGNTPVLFPVQESRQVIVHKYLLLGAIFMTEDHEREIVQCDLGRMDLMLHRNTKPITYLDECNIFTLAHAQAHGIDQIDDYWDQYIDRLMKLQAKVIFLNVHPDISWQRRKEVYEQRLVYFKSEEHESIRVAYKNYIFQLHPLLRTLYEKLPLPKVMIDATCSEKQLLERVSRAIASLSSLIR